VMYSPPSVAPCGRVLTVAVTSDAASQDALSGGVFEDLRVIAKSFQPPEWKEALT
jgi:hypothetical protein